MKCLVVFVAAFAACSGRRRSATRVPDDDENANSEVCSPMGQLLSFLDRCGKCETTDDDATLAANDE
jgi:hypothetical protein